MIGLLAAGVAHADDLNNDGVDDDLYIVRHQPTPCWLSGQVNVISQAQPGFHSPYAGTNSFLPDDHSQTSYVATVYGAYELTPNFAVMVSGESAGGGGLSTALGLAGFTNLDVVRNPALGPTPYLGRALIDAIIPLSHEYVIAERVPFDVLRRLPTHRIEIRAGKVSTVDMFDNNSVGTDSHLQFMNWAVDNNGAYDYAADTRGYTLGAIVEVAGPLYAVRFGELLMQTVANGIDYDFDIAHARGENLEVELHDCIAGRAGIVRLLAFYNHARMGNYDEANAIARLDPTVPPDIIATREPGRTKKGFGFNVEHEVTSTVRAFTRLGWSDGINESFAYTEIDNTGAGRRRRQDRRRQARPRGGHERAVRAAPHVPRARRPRLPARRRPAALRPRGHRGGLLHVPGAPRDLPGHRRPGDREPRLQRRPRAGHRRLAAAARRDLVAERAAVVARDDVRVAGDERDGPGRAHVERGEQRRVRKAGAVEGGGERGRGAGVAGGEVRDELDHLRRAPARVDRAELLRGADHQQIERGVRERVPACSGCAARSAARASSRAAS